MVNGSNVKTLATEWFVVSIGCGLPTQPQNILMHYDFPVSNRMGFEGLRVISNTDVKNYLARHRNEPPYVKYSSFHLLLYLCIMIDPETAFTMAEAVRDQTSIDSGLEVLINSLQ
jgi:hypothetical protein